MMTAKQKVQSLVSLIKERGLGYVTASFGLSVKYHKTYPSLAQFKYDQIRSDMNHPIPQVCRGIILDTEEDYQVVALPYTKFFNYGEASADPIDWSTARVYEKLDGSIITMYWYKNNWHVASSGLPDASGKAVGYRQLHGKEWQENDPVIRDEFWRIWKEKNYKLPLDTRKCFMFELMLNKHRNIVYSEDRIVLHGARDLNSLTEADPVAVAKEHEWDCVKIIPATSIEEVVEIAKTLKPSEAEGFVVADAEFRRVKIKSPQYVALSLLSEKIPELNQQRILEIVRANEGPEFLAYFPHVNGLFNAVKSRYDRMCADYDAKLTTLRAETQGDTKKFAVGAQKIEPKFKWIFFTAQKSGAQSVREVFAGVEAQIIDKVLLHFENSHGGADSGGENVPDYAFSGAKKREKAKRENSTKSEKDAKVEDAKIEATVVENTVAKTEK